MFSLKEKTLICNMSNFTLGIDIVVFEGGVVLAKTTATSKEEAISMVYSLCETQDIKNVFIQPLAPTNTDKLMNEFKMFGQTKFSKTFDKIHFHMI